MMAPGVHALSGSAPRAWQPVVLVRWPMWDGATGVGLGVLGGGSAVAVDVGAASVDVAAIAAVGVDGTTTTGGGVMVGAGVRVESATVAVDGIDGVS